MNLNLWLWQKLTSNDIYGQAYHLMLKTAMVFLKSSGKDWQLAAIPKRASKTTWILKVQWELKTCAQSFWANFASKLPQNWC